MAEGKADRRQEIESLLAERKKYEAWLAQLDARRDAAPSHVYERVHGDYRKRLDAVGEKLAAETGAIEDLVGELEGRLEEEQDAVTTRSDERAEAELRAAVGEFSEKEWAARRRKLDDAIDDLRSKFDATERELVVLKELLGSVSGTGAPARPSLEQAAIARVTGDLAIAGDPPQAEVGAGEPAADEGDTAAGVLAADETDAGDVDAVVAEEMVSVEASVDEEQVDEEQVEEERVEVELPIEEVATVEDSSVIGTGGVTESAHDTGVVDSPSPLSAMPPDDAAADVEEVAAEGELEAAPDADPARAPEFDELAFLRSVAGTPTSPHGTKAVGGGPPRPARRDSRPPAKGAAAAPPELPDLTPPGPSPLGAPTPRTSQAVRSLKCGECGTLNFPTEWYCERCGGELAAF
ncbi:MAG: zinc finger Ran-binding domain-containing protein [Gemmatimonadota bacterium]|nr:zinc finger Ran-binding domain-containing protein [Gemmatimonadota bacterium]